MTDADVNESDLLDYEEEDQVEPAVANGGDPPPPWTRSPA